MISSLENAVDAFKAHGPIKSDAKSAPDQIVNLLARLLEKQNKIDATDPDMLEDGLAAIDSLLHSHDDEYPKLSNSRSLLLAATQCFAGELRAWFDNLLADHEGRRSWATLKTHIFARFPPGNAQQRAHQKLFELRCVDGSDWHRFTIKVQACAKKAKVDDSAPLQNAGRAVAEPGSAKALSLSRIEELIGCFDIPGRANGIDPLLRRYVIKKLYGHGAFDAVDDTGM